MTFLSYVNESGCRVTKYALLYVYFSFRFFVLFCFNFVIFLGDFTAVSLGFVDNFFPQFTTWTQIILGYASTDTRCFTKRTGLCIVLFYRIRWHYMNKIVIEG